MEQTNKLSNQQNHPVTLIKPLLIGAAIALFLIGFFLSGVHDPKPEWGKLWMIKPLIIVPMAGATGGAFYYFMDQVSSRGGWNKTVDILLSLIVYIIGLWLGTVLGLNGTLWN
jgi:hypothetical protein